MPTRFAGSGEETLALDVFIKLNRATMSVARRVHAPLREFGLTPIQFGVLDALAFAGPLPVSAIAEKNLCSQNSLSTVIDTMERNGLVERERSEEDRRIVQISLTSKGQETFEKAWPLILEGIIDASHALSGPELKKLNQLLRKMGRTDAN